jgi:hypothetical protein
MVTQSPPKEEKPSFGDYQAWLAENDHIQDLEVHKTHYEMITRMVAETYQNSPFWIEILKGLKDVDAKYLIDHKYPLITETAPPIVIKPWNSFLEKTFRKNISHNARFSSPT